MRVIRSLAIAFSMYCAIPVPSAVWKKEDMKYVLCFFPWIGAVIGLCEVCWGWLCRKFSVGNLCFAFVGTAIPLIVTGGLHADGFLDTMDAFHCFRERERKLEILKDSHIGAFSVIMLTLYYLIYAAAFSELRDRRQILSVGVGFVLSRTLSGIGAVVFRPAKREGLLRTFSDAAAKRTTLIWLVLQLLLCAAALLFLSVGTGLAALAAAFLSFAYYRYRSYKELGGVTGDTAGFFLLCCEAVILLAVAAAGKAGGRF